MMKMFLRNENVGNQPGSATKFHKHFMTAHVHPLIEVAAKGPKHTRLGTERPLSEDERSEEKPIPVSENSGAKDRLADFNIDVLTASMERTNLEFIIVSF